MNRHMSPARHLLVAFVLCLPILILVSLLARADHRIDQQAALVVLSSDSDNVVVRLEVPAYVLQVSGVGAEPALVIEAPGLSGSTASPGRPAIPYYSTLVAVPPDAAVALQVISVESEQKQLSLPLEPASTPRSGFPLDDSPISPVAPVSIGALDGPYPAELATVSAPQYFRNQRLVRLNLFPFQYDSELRQLTVSRQMIVQVVFSGAKTDGAEEAAGSNGAIEALSRRSVLNYEQGRGWRGYPADMVFPHASLPVGVPVFKIEVDTDGMYQITFDDLVAAGIDISNTNPVSLSLSSGGVPVAIDWLGDDDDVFEPDEAFAFYGQQYHNTDWEEQYTDINVYWLQLASQPGLRMESVDGTPSGAPPVNNYVASVRVENDAKFTHLHTTDLGEVDAWYMKKTTGGTATSFPLTLTALAPGVYTASVRLEQFSDCRYTGAPELHQVQVRLNEIPIDAQSWQTQGGTDNCSVHLLSGPIDQSDLLEGGANTLTWVVSSTHPYGEWLNWWEVRYQRRLEAVEDKLIFGLDIVGEWTYTVTGFSTDLVAVWTVSDPHTPTRISSPLIQGDASYSVAFQLDQSTPGKAAIVAFGSLATPLRISRYVPPELNPSGGADWIAISHGDFITEVRRLADYRTEQGLRTWVADIDDVYNQYGSGIQRPAAIRDYLIGALSWTSPAPSFVVLAGDGNWNYKSIPACYSPCDPDPIFVPPLMAVVDPYLGQIPADNLYATLVYSDPIPDIALGRLPVRTLDEAAELVDRIIQHEAQLLEPESWQYDLTFLADADDPGAGDFPADSDIVVNQLPSYLQSNRIYHMVEPYTTTEATRDALVQAFNQGTTMVNYRGHGGVVLWGASNFFNVGYLSLLTNTHRLPVVFSFDCLDTYYAIPSYQSIAESMVRHPSGGSVAHWGSTGLGISSDHLILNRALIAGVFEDGLGRLGEAVLAAKLAFAGAGWQMHNLHTFTLLGDPAMPLMASDLRIETGPGDMPSRHAGNSLSHVIRVTNDGLLWGTGAVLTDIVPAELLLHDVTWSGLQITPTVGASYTWSVGPMLPYATGVITISGRIDPELAITSPLTLTRISEISASSLDWNPMNNTSTRSILLVPGGDIYLPMLVRGQ